MKIGLIAMSGVRVRNPELAALGVTLPQFVNRGKVIASLPSLGLLTVAGLTPDDCEVAYRELADLPGEEDALEPFDLVEAAPTHRDMLVWLGFAARDDTAERHEPDRESIVGMHDRRLLRANRDFDPELLAQDVEQRRQRVQPDHPFVVVRHASGLVEDRSQVKEQQQADNHDLRHVAEVDARRRREPGQPTYEEELYDG